MQAREPIDSIKPLALHVILPFAQKDQMPDIDVDSFQDTLFFRSHMTNKRKL